jgi:urea carboxylase-associated protein 2
MNMSDHPTESLLFEDLVPGGGMWSWVVRRHTTLRLTALEPGVNVALLAYNADDKLDRLNIPDTLKAQYTAKLTRGHILMSDMGRALLSITADTVGWHDPLSGHGDAALALKKYGEGSYQQLRNDWYRNARDQFLVELGKHGLDTRDLVANINFFSRVTVDEQGHFQFKENHAKAGDSVELRAEMNTLVVLNTCPHPLDPSPAYKPGALKVSLHQTPPAAADDYCRNFRAENQRCFALTERFFAGS